MSILLRRLILLWVVAVIPLLFWTESMDMFEQPKQLAMKSAAPFIALMPVPVFLPAPLAAALIGILALGLVSSLFSPLPMYSWFGEYSSYQGWFQWISLAVLFTALSSLLRKPGEPRRFLVAAALSAGLVAGYALVQVAGLDPFQWSNGGNFFRAFSTAGNPLYMGFLLSAMVPACIGLARSTPTTGGRNLWLAIALLVFMGTLSSGSRSAAAGALVGAGLLIAPGAGFGTGKPFPRKPFTAFVLAVLLASLAALPADRNPVTVLASRLSQLVQGGDARPTIWAGAGMLIRERPLSGHGLDTFATLHPRVQSPRLWEKLWHASPEKAHNEFIQVAATAGIPAAGLLVWLAVWLASLALRNRHDPLCASAGAGLGAMAVPAMFGFITVGTQSMALLLAAILVARTRSAMEMPEPWLKLAGAAMAIALGFHIQYASSLVALKDAVRDGGAGMERVLALRTPWAQNLLQAGDTLERGWFGPGLAPAPDSDARLGLLSRIYSSAVSANPLHAFCHSAAGRTAFRAGRIAEAMTAYEKARTLAPRDAYLPMEEAQMLISSRRENEGLVLLETASKMYPRFAEPAGLIGYLWLARKKPAMAEPWLKKAVEGEWHGNNAAAYAAAVNLVVLYRNAGRWNESAWAESVAGKYAPGGVIRP